VKSWRHNDLACGTNIDAACTDCASTRHGRGMIRHDAALPLALVAFQAAVAGLAALGFLSLVPVATTPGTLVVVVPLLGVSATAGLVMVGEHAAARRRGVAVRHALRHPLTGLVTRDYTEQTLAAEFAAAQRGRGLTVVLFRIEQFPRLAVRHGRPAAERVLRAAGRVLQAHTRGMHTSGHHGPHEGTYVSILSGTAVDGACVFAKRVRRDLMALTGMPEPLVVSAGVIAYDVSMASVKELVDGAEHALVKAAAGNGKIVVLGHGVA
jgi:diguanylate cyclase (GGDEF)-like protein